MGKSNQLSGPRFLRLNQILQRVPVGRSTWWLWVKQGKVPAPVKLGPRVSAWREDVIDNLGDQSKLDGGAQ